MTNAQFEEIKAILIKMQNELSYIEINTGNISSMKDEIEDLKKAIIKSNKANEG